MNRFVICHLWREDIIRYKVKIRYEEMKHEAKIQSMLTLKYSEQHNNNKKSNTVTVIIKRNGGQEEVDD